MSKKKIIILMVMVFLPFLLTGCVSKTDKKIIEAGSDIVCYGFKNGIDPIILVQKRQKGEMSKEDAAIAMQELKKKWNEIAQKYGFSSWEDYNKSYAFSKKSKEIEEKLMKKRVKEKCGLEY